MQPDHLLRRYDPRRSLEFDEQFWPVAVAMCVLAALTIGTIVTVLDGPWMWFSLLALPAGVAVALAGLHRIERRWLRRSVQTALVLSLAMHLLILILAYGARVFAGPRPTRVAVARTVTPERTLEIASQRREQFWTQPNEVATPEPEVVVEREPTPPQPDEPTVQPQPNVAAETAPSPLLERRENSAEATPRAGASLSRASRQLEAEAPQAQATAVAESAPAQREPTAARQPEPSAAALAAPRRSDTAAAVPLKNIAPEPQPRAAEVRDRTRREEAARQQIAAAPAATRPDRDLPIEPAAAEPVVRPNAATPASRETTAAETAVTRADSASAVRKSAPSPETTPQTTASDVARRTSSEAETAAPQRVSRSEPLRSPRAPAATDAPSETPRATARSEATVAPSPESARWTRQTTQSEMTATTPRANPTETRARESNLARAANPTESPATAPSVSPAAANRPRPALEVAATPQTATPTATPSAAASAATPAAATPAAQPLAMQRATGGTSGAGASPNFGRAPDSSPSPALTALDSSQRSRAASRDAAVESLTPSPQARVARATGAATVPEHSIPATSDQAALAGSRRPSELVASAAAALTAASAAAETGENSLEKGNGEVDVGPTKIVGSVARRAEAAGGGRPELSNVPAALGSKAASGAGVEPQLAANTIAPQAAAPASEGSPSPRADQASPSATASVTTRDGGEQSATTGLSRSEVTAELPATASLAPEQGQSPSAAERAERADEGVAGESSWEDDEEQRRRARRERDVALDGLAADDVEPSSSARSAPSGAPQAIDGLSETGTMERAAPLASGELARTRGEHVGDAELPAAETPTVPRADRAGTASGSARAGTAATSRREASSGALEPASTTGPDVAQGTATAPSARDLVSAQGLALERSAGRDAASLGRTRAETPATTDRPGLASEFGSRNEGESEPSERMLAAASGERTSDAALQVDPQAVPAASAVPGRGTASPAAELAAQLAPASRSAQPGLRVEIDRESGEGGLADLPEREVGVNSRRASPDSDLLAAEPTQRFAQRDPSGTWSAPQPSGPTPAAFAGRSPGKLGDAGPQTEAAIEAGLAFLVRYQGPDGRWSLLGFDDNDPAKQFQLDSDTAATGLAVLAFQGAGYTHRQYKYQDQVARGITWLIQHQADNGNLYVASDEVSNRSCQFYSHAIATLALAEAYGMTQDPSLREPIERAVRFLETSQDPVNGGWRYFADPKHPNPQLRASTDTSVTGWVVTALHSARLAGVEIAPTTWAGVERWLATAHAANDESQFRYNPFAPDIDKQRAGREPSLSMTSVGLLMRMYTGWDRNDPRLIAGARELLRQLPAESNTLVRDTYYWYYATQVLRHVDGELWQQWNAALHPLLIQTQQPTGPLAGSWHPYYPVEDRWGKNGGRLYVTTLNLLSLEVDYRLLPLYEQTTSPRVAD